MSKTELASIILQRLQEKNPHPQIELSFSNAFELLMATILAAQCTDARVNILTKSFFKEYPTAKKIAQESPEKIAKKIKSTGFYRNKAISLVSCCQRLMVEHNGVVPDSVEVLAKLPGVGRKTACTVVGNAYGKPAMAVDTHVKRVANRLKLSSSESTDHIETELMQIVAEKDWTLFAQLMVLHGRYICMARTPRCIECGLFDLCSWEEKPSLQHLK